MATELELEKTYLARELPADLDSVRSEIISDRYMPMDAVHPVIRLRRRGEQYELTKKVPVEGNDSSKQDEHTIPLTKAEYDIFTTIPAKSFTKIRHYCIIDGHDAEVDVYREELAGLVVIDFEFTSEEEMAVFQTPAICLADVTQEEMIAGGILAGKSYGDIQPTLEAYKYKPLKVGANA